MTKWQWPYDNNRIIMKKWQTQDANDQIMATAYENDKKTMTILQWSKDN